MQAQAVRALGLEAKQAKRLAEVVLFATWIERTGLATSVSPPYLRLDPADPVIIDAGALTWPARLLSACTLEDWPSHLRSGFPSLLISGQLDELVTSPRHPLDIGVRSTPGVMRDVRN